MCSYMQVFTVSEMQPSNHQKMQMSLEEMNKINIASLYGNLMTQVTAKVETKVPSKHSKKNSKLVPKTHTLLFCLFCHTVDMLAKA